MGPMKNITDQKKGTKSQTITIGFAMRTKRIIRHVFRTISGPQEDTNSYLKTAERHI